MVKSILKRKRNKRKHTKRVRFNKHKKVKTFKKGKKMKISKKAKKKRSKTRKGRKGKNKKRMKKTKKRRFRVKMKGGSNMGERITGIKLNQLNPQDYQHPESTNLNSNVPLPHQEGGGILDSFGLGDIPYVGHNIMNVGKDAISLVTGNDKVIPANPVIHPEMEKSLLKYPDAIDVNKIYNDSNTVSATTTSPATATPAAATTAEAGTTSSTTTAPPSV